MREARKAGVRVLTRLNSNFVVVRFGTKFRKEDVLSNIKPIQWAIEGKSYIICPFKRCIWQWTAGNMFLVRGEGYDDFIPLFTTSLNTKPETAIMKYNFIQYMRRYLTDMGFKDVLEGISVHLLREQPPKCVFSVRNAFEGALGNIGCEKPKIK